MNGNCVISFCTGVIVTVRNDDSLAERKRKELEKGGSRGREEAGVGHNQNMCAGENPAFER